MIANSTDLQLFSQLQSPAQPLYLLSIPLSQTDENSWHTAIAASCQTMIKDDLKEFLLCVGLNVVLSKTDIQKINEKDVTHLLDALDIGVKRIQGEVLSPFRAIARLSLLILVAETMLAIGYQGSGFAHPITNSLTELLEHSFPTEVIVKPQAWYARNLLLGTQSSGQIMEGGRSAAWATVKGILALIKVGVAAGAMVSPIITPLALIALIPLLVAGGLGIIDNLITAHQHFKTVAHHKLSYNAHIHHEIEYLTRGSAVLYLPTSLSHLDTLDVISIKKYLDDIVMPHVLKQENYHGINTIIIIDIIDILAARLFTIDQPRIIALIFESFVKIFERCNEHFSRFTLHIHHGSYNGVRSYFLYNLYRLKKYAKNGDVKLLSAFFIRSKIQGDAKMDKKLEEMVDRMPAMQEFCIDQNFNIVNTTAQAALARSNIAIQASRVSINPPAFATFV